MPIYKIQKRNGAMADFDSSKIRASVLKALRSVEHSDDAVSEVVADLVTAKVEQKLEEKHSNTIPDVDRIAEILEATLMKFGYTKAAKAFILNRARSGDAGVRDVVVEVKKTIGEYLSKLDWRVNANSNQGYSLGGMILNTAGKVTANYWLSYVYPREIGEAHRNADLHIHDLDMFSGYCAGWSLRALLEEGFNGVSNKVESLPPKRLSSAVAQMVNFLGTLQNEWAGAQAFSSFDTYMAPFVKKYDMELRASIAETKSTMTPEEIEKFVDEKVFDYVFQNIQAFVFNLNVPSRWGTQTPFTNITLDWTVPDDLKDKRLLLGGEPFAFTFGELEKEMGVVNRAFIKVMTAGDSKGRAFTFPIPTYNITKDFDWNDPKTLPLFEMTAKFGTPYFQNFVNSTLNPSDVRSMCCRLQLDLKELRRRGGGLFGSAEMTGSIGVVTINAARIGYMCKGDKQAFLKRLFVLMDFAKRSLELKRREIEKWLEGGLFPYTKRYLGHLTNHFSTIGINGLNEAVRNLTSDRESIATPQGQELSKEILDAMLDRMREYQEETGNLYNLEATPAEGTTYRFAKEDKKRFPEIIQAGTEEAPYYTNSSQLPVGITDDVFEALELQDDLQTKYTGGTVFHCYMNERISSAEACRNLVKKILGRFKLPYITITPTFSICPKHGYLKGEYDFCPVCDEALGITDEAPRLDDALRSEYISEKENKKDVKSSVINQ